jgi:hypothetical protein
MSGTLKVVEPSPAPKVVPITLKRAAYVVRLTADPSQTSQPVGADAPAYILTSPVKTPREP